MKDTGIQAKALKVQKISKRDIGIHRWNGEPLRDTIGPQSTDKPGKSVRSSRDRAVAPFQEFRFRFLYDEQGLVPLLQCACISRMVKMGMGQNDCSGSPGAVKETEQAPAIARPACVDKNPGIALPDHKNI